jgi:DNA-binding SARP family transcriptional activator/TolB-like protein
MARVRLTLLGGFTASLAEGTALALPTRKAEALLALLACRPGEPRQRESLMALLWGDRSDTQARHSLSQALTSIRHAVDDKAPLLVTERDTVALSPEGAEVDVVEFRRRVESGTLDDLRTAVELYRGPLLDGLKLREPGFEEWLGQERVRLHELAISAFVNLAQQQIAIGDLDAAVAALGRALALDPLSEELHRRLIQLHLDQGAYNAAIRCSRQCAEILKRELDTTPEPATTALYQQALNALAHAPDIDRPPSPPEPKRGEAGPRADSIADLSPAERRRPSIAVMPLAELTPGPAQNRLADGLVHDVITQLAKLRSLFVIARGSVFALGEQGLGPQEAGRVLKVDYVVSGSVSRRGDRVAVMIELAETATGTIIWNDVLDRKLDDAFLILDELCNRIVASIASEIEMVERNRAVLKPPSSLDAWEAYHRGLWHAYRFNAADNDRAHHFFQMAARLDPTYARAYVGLSFTHFQNAFLFRTAERELETERAFETAGRGLIIDDRDPGAHWAMGRALWLRGRPDQSLVELDNAVELSPNFALGHYQLAFVHCQSGDPKAAILSSDYSRHLCPCDPLLFAMLGTRALAQLRLGQFEEAAEWSVKAALRPNAHVHIMGIAAHCLALAGRLDEARSFVALIHKIAPQYREADFLAAFQFSPDTVGLFRKGARQIGMA